LVKRRWAYEPDERPNFDEIVSELGSFIANVDDAW
jgi:hypothetical protein